MKLISKNAKVLLIEISLSASSDDGDTTMKASRTSEGSARYESADSPPRRAGPIDLTGNSSSDGSPEIQIVRKSIPAAPRYVGPPAQPAKAPQQYRQVQQQLPFKPLPALQNSDPRFSRTPPESPTSYNNRQNALKNNNPLPPPARPFASSSAAFSTVNSAKQAAYDKMQVRNFSPSAISFIHFSNFSSLRRRLSTPNSDYPR